MRLFLHFLHAKTHPNFWEQCSKHLSGTLLSSDQLTLAQRQWSGGRLLFSGLIVWEELACSKEAGRMFVWKEAGRILVWQVCVCVLALPHPLRLLSALECSLPAPRGLLGREKVFIL